MEILKVQGLRKEYKSVVALDSLNFSLKKGQVLGLLGPNGSGKTTTLGILLGVIKSDSGTFSWFDNGTKDENRKRIGALLETPNFFPYLNAIDNLKIVAKIKDFDLTGKGGDRIMEVLQIVGLAERAKDKFRTYSLGMKQRLAIGSALLTDPEVLVLDEPTNGLDPQGIAEIRTLVNRIAEQGKTIIIASHILDEIEKICTDVLILRKGKLLRDGTLDEIMTQDYILILETEDPGEAKKAMAQFDFLEIIKEKDKTFAVKVQDDKSPSQVNKAFAEKGVYLSEIKRYKKSLETTFLEILDNE